MSFESLLNHKVRIYRDPDLLASRDEMGAVSPDPEPVMAVPDSYNARPDQFWRGDQRDTGPGESQFRLRRWFLHKDVDVRDRDYLSVVAGPEAGRVWRVLRAAPMSARGPEIHHWECNCEEWVGTLA